MEGRSRILGAMNARPAPPPPCRVVGVLAAVGALAACKPQGNDKARPPGTLSATPARPGAALPAAPAATSSPRAAPEARPASSESARAEGAAKKSTPWLVSDPCSLLNGPIQLSFTGAASVWVSEEAQPNQDPTILFNRDGVARPVYLPHPAPRTDASAKADPRPAGARDAASTKANRPERLALTEAPERATAPGCAIAGGFVFCMATSGVIHRTTLAGEGDTVIATGRPGSSIAAATSGGQQPVIAFLANRRTSEGAVTLAFAALGDSTPVQLSEDGSGATFVTLAPRGDQAVAMYIDARRALTPLHARVLSAATGKLRLGTDAVLFVGEASDGRTVGAVALGESGPAFGLLPTFKDTTTFGVAAIRIDEQPRDDAPVTWSTYPGSIEPAPIAATRGVSPVRVALVRPASNEPKPKQVLELGEIDPSGNIKPLCTVAESSKFGDVSLTPDRFGTLWLVYTDAQGTWIERRGKAP
jgi:hypothetical protein